MGEITEENVPFLGLDEFIEEINEVDENILRYDDNLEKIKDIQTKLMKGIGWGQEARKNLSDDLEKLAKHNKAIEKAVIAKIREGYATKFTADSEEKTRQEKLASSAKRMMEAVSKYKNINIQFKEKSKQKLVNSIKITGAKLSEEEIKDKIERDDIESILSETEDTNDQYDEVKDRHEALKQLEEEILDLDELYKETMELVQGQDVTGNITEEKINITKDDTNNLNQFPFQFQLKSFEDFYEAVMLKKKVLAMVGAAILLLLLIIIISASTSGSTTEPESKSLNVEETTESVEVEPEPCDPNEDPDCVG